MARARCPRSSVEASPKCVKSKGQNKATFFSPSENRCLPASTLKPEEREFVVDSGASMHMISKKERMRAIECAVHESAENMRAVRC